MPNPALRPGSDEEWDALLRQLGPASGTPPRPFFYARVRARLAAQAQAQAERRWLPGWLRRPAYAALLGALVLAVSRDGAALPAAAVPAQYQSTPPPLSPPH